MNMYSHVNINEDVSVLEPATNTSTLSRRANAVTNQFVFLKSYLPILFVFTFLLIITYIITYRSTGVNSDTGN